MVELILGLNIDGDDSGLDILEISDENLDILTISQISSSTAVLPNFRVCQAVQIVRDV
jgi:hypothetical protein